MEVLGNGFLDVFIGISWNMVVMLYNIVIMYGWAYAFIIYVVGYVDYEKRIIWVFFFIYVRDMLEFCYKIVIE